MVKVTGPGPDAASVSLNVVLAATVVDPEVGAVWTMGSAVTVSEYDHVPVSPLRSESVPEIV